MADGQSSPPCAPLGVLLLLIGGICSVQAGPTDFWCNRQVRKTMEKEIVGLRADMLQQKSAEVVEALRVFWDGVRVAKNQSTSECQTSLLEKLERHMANYVAIVSRLQMQSGAVTPPPSSPRSCSSVTSTSEVLKQYGNLLRGKLERLAADLRDKAPESRQRSTAAEGRCG